MRKLFLLILACFVLWILTLNVFTEKRSSVEKTKTDLEKEAHKVYGEDTATLKDFGIH